MDKAYAQRAKFCTYVMAGATRTLRNNPRGAMSIKVVYKNGLFEPLEEVKDARDGQRFTVFADDELADIRETLEWLKVAEKSFEFWNDPADAIYDEI